VSEYLVGETHSLSDEGFEQYCTLIHALSPQRSSYRRVVLRESIEKVLSSPEHCLIVAMPHSKDRLIGTMLLVSRLHNPEVVEVHDVIVLPEWRGRGVFTAMHAYAVQRALQFPHARRMHLTSGPDRTEARERYIALGWEQGHDTTVFTYKLLRE
jgi:GNAT superfamily N-acetyltransferase